jgi:phosphatidylglycerophosphate synthase
VAARLAELAASPPPAWEREFERKTEDWRRRLWRAAVLRQTGTAPPADEIPEAPPLEPTDEGALALRVRAAREDAVALLLAGLVRSDAHVGSSHLRGFFYSRPLSDAEASVAEAELRGLDEDRIALDAAVKATDGFFTTFFVSPYSKYIARFAARRGWTPNAVTIVSMAIGVASAAAFAVGSRGGLIAGAVLLQVAFTVDCVDGQLARYTRTFSKLGAWLDSVFDRAKEYLVYAGLAIGSSRAFSDDVWLLAACALALQTARHMVIFSWATGGRQQVAGRAQPPLEQPEDVAVPPEATEPSETAEPSEEVAPDAAVPPAGGPPGLARRGVIAITALERWNATRWAKRIIALPIGERFALISVTAAVASPRTTFWALLGWGAVASLYSVGGRLLRSVAR